MKFIRFLLNRPVSVLLIIFSVVIYGVISIRTTRMEFFPSMEFPMEVVVVSYPGADADSMERLIVEKIEEAGATLSGVTDIESESQENMATIMFSYKFGTDMNNAYSELKGEVDNLRNDLPEGVAAIRIIEMSMNLEANITLAAKATDGTNVVEYVKNTVEPALKSLSGVGSVDIQGGGEQYCKIVMDESKMKQYGITLGQVATDIAQADFDLPVGNLEFGTQNVPANAYTDLDNTSISDIAVHTNKGALIHLGDLVSSLYIAEDEANAISRYNGQDVVLIDVKKKSSAATMAVCDAVKKEAKKLETESISFDVVHTDSDDIMSTLMEVLKTLLEGVTITMLVIFLFMGDLRASFIISLAMPLSMFLAFIALKALDIQFDLMSGIGLIIAIGMLVDNSIVVLESCFKMQEEGHEFKDAATLGTSAMLFSVLGSTITTVVVYLPVALIAGIPGQLFRPICFSIIFTMLASLIDSVTVVPLLFTLFKPRAKAELPINKLLAAASKAYNRVMPKVLKHPAVPILITICLFVISIFLLRFLNKETFPPAYNGSMKVEAAFRSGTKLETMDERIKRIEDVLVKDENFNSVDLKITSSGVNITAHAKEGTKRTSEEAVSYYTKLFSDVTDMDLLFKPSGVSTGLGRFTSGNKETVTVEASDIKSLEKASIIVEDKLRSIPGVIDVKNSATVRKTSAKFNIDQQAAREAGLQPSEISSWISQRLRGINATSAEFEGLGNMEVWVKYPDHEYNDPSVLLSQSIDIGGGKMKPAKDLVSIEYTELMESIHRKNGKFQAEVTATFDSDYYFELKDKISAAKDEIKFPYGAGYPEGSSEDDEERDLLISLFTAIFLIFLVMGIQFESVRYSLMVMMCIPFSLIGSFGFMFILHETFSFFAIMGMLMLVGMVVNNGIMLIDATNEYIKGGMVVGEALITAGTTRIRPILMTTLTTVLSMVPLLLSGDSGVNMMRGMGVVIIGGLTASTILAMFLMPPFYLLFSGKDMNGMTGKERRAARKTVSGKTEKESRLKRFFSRKKKDVKEGQNESDEK